MKILKTLLVMTVIYFAISPAFAEGVGFIDYKKVQDNYAYAQSAVKEIDNKALELRQFIVDKEKQYKALDTPLKQKTLKKKQKRNSKQDNLLTSTSN